MESCIYAGSVEHRREAHAAHRFRYRLFMLYLDLGELDRVFEGRWLWSVERPNWASFRRADHFRGPGPLDAAIRDAAREQLGFRPAGPIRLLTHLRYLGYCFNPISVYYCFGEDGKGLEAIVAEVHNTPWGEEYVRALDARGGPDGDGWHSYPVDKEFHVSPFMPMDIVYRWRFSPPGKRLAARIENFRGGERIFEAGLDLERRPLTGGNLARALLRWPFMTGMVIWGIYWQALRLKLKGVPYHPHPGELNVTKGAFHK
jgi:DUF1365 family protein